MVGFQAAVHRVLSTTSHPGFAGDHRAARNTTSTSPIAYPTAQMDSPTFPAAHSAAYVNPTTYATVDATSKQSLRKIRTLFSFLRERQWAATRQSDT
jgi:hypothetical protein